jgi:hypothetical protein
MALVEASLPLVDVTFFGSALFNVLILIQPAKLAK